MKKHFFNLLQRVFFSSGQTQLDNRIRRTLDVWVKEKGYLKPLSTVEDIAGDIGIPADLLGVHLRFHYDKTLLTWRKELRMEEAKRLLLAFPDLPISTVGEMVGILDKSNFRKQFKETVRMSPREWRQRHGI